MKKVLGSLYVQVLIAIAIGIVFGFLDPAHATAMKPLGDAFIKIVKMLIAPIIFTTVVLGVGQAGDMKEVGRIGLKAMLYFEGVTIFAPIIGLVIVNVLQPGRGIIFDPAAVDMKSVSAYTAPAQQLTTVDFLMNVIPDTLVGAFARGEILQVLFVSVLLGLVLLKLGPAMAPLTGFIELVSQALFTLVGFVMRAAPIGAFGAMAFAVGKYGIAALVTLGKLMFGVYLACGLFILGIVNIIMAIHGFSLIRFLRYIGAEILIVLGTSSSEAALPRLMDKMEKLGCAKRVVGIVVPAGYSFNLDGTSIYMTMAAVFVAQVSGVNLSISQQVGLLAVLMLTSKGAAGVTGSGFVTLAATLAIFPAVPLGGLTLLLGVDRFMSEARAITNFIGNAVATLIVSKWERALDESVAKRIVG
ncbi:MAG: C4-dicarboxylate transporter DctA [Acidobacteria bacterium]|nr:MAG: C4-dicarboxylate transporter DctA [Acidobacteriota bacterium]